MKKGEQGQAIILTVLLLGLLLIGAMGLAVDGAQIYAHREMAQAAADAAAQAGMLSVFDGTNTGSNAFGSAQHICTTTDTISPCKYAALNGFGTTSSDTVTLDFPASTTPPAGVTLSPTTTDPVNFIKVTITRALPTSLMGLLGATSTTVKAVAYAAIVDVVAPVPIIVTHPSNSNVLDTGTGSITITGGPQRSIQVNSNSATAISSPNVDLSKAGPNGNGADFGVTGGPVATPGSINFGTAGTGRYIPHDSRIQDPLASVNPPSPVPAVHAATVSNGCGAGCDLYSPGLWDGGLSVKNVTNMQFKPGVYYVRNGDFSLKNSTANMCTTCAADPNTGAGMLVYHTDTVGGPTGFVIDTGVTANLLGAGVSTATPPTAPTSPYYGILFFQDRSAARKDHTFGQGNGCFTLVGTVYITNTFAIMSATPSQYQSISYNGNPCSTTAAQGEIITGSISMVGKKDVINMLLYPQGFLTVRQVALVQ
jgi:hypothetical protein